MRYEHCPRIPMAQGDPDPAWPLAETKPRFATWSLCGVRPSSCVKDKDTKCIRWHSGIDLIDAKDGALVVAPENLEIVRVDVNWSAGSFAWP